ncbi:MAG: (d)CMP kinase [Dehalococcoidia bacterium]
MPSTSQQAEKEPPPRAIAIDGPVASGKSAVGSRVARELGHRFIDTGLMYRAVTVVALERGIDLHDEAPLAQLAANLSLTIEPPARVLVDAVDVTPKLRTAEVGEAVSLVSRVPGVREAMVKLQRQLARDGGVVMVGRDIGTVVLPDAPLKLYLDASPEERVRRRHEELRAAGQDISDDEVRQELALRDRIDSERATSPLRPAADAVHIDTDRLSLDEVVARILKLACPS